MDRTDSEIDTPATRSRSGPVRYEVVCLNDKAGPFDTAVSAAEWAEKNWPWMGPDPDHAGHGWDIQVVGA